MISIVSSTRRVSLHLLRGSLDFLSWVCIVLIFASRPPHHLVFHCDRFLGSFSCLPIFFRTLNLTWILWPSLPLPSPTPFHKAQPFLATWCPVWIPALFPSGSALWLFRFLTLSVIQCLSHRIVVEIKWISICKALKALSGTCIVIAGYCDITAGLFPFPTSLFLASWGSPLPQTLTACPIVLF